MKFSRKVDKPLILYGAGKLGRLAKEVLEERLHIYGAVFADRNRRKCWKPDDIARFVYKEDYLVAVCVTTEPFHAIKRSLEALGYADIVPVYDIFSAYPECGITNGWTVDGRCKLHYLFEEFQSVVHHWTFYAYRKSRSEAGMEICHHPRYYIPEIIALTSTRFEEEGSTLADIEARRKVITLTEPQDYIRLHLEGCELPTLRKNIKWLQKHRPILAVCCYHNRDGLYKIPKFCMDNLPEYRFLFRVHSYMGQGAVLYCIPNERKPL